jgi:hypothetical protein
VKLVLHLFQDRLLGLGRSGLREIEELRLRPSPVPQRIAERGVANEPHERLRAATAPAGARQVVAPHDHRGVPTVVECDDLRVKGTNLLDLVFALLGDLRLRRIRSLGGGHDLARLERPQRLALGPERDGDAVGADRRCALA